MARGLKCSLKKGRSLLAMTSMGETDLSIPVDSARNQTLMKELGLWSSRPPLRENLSSPRAIHGTRSCPSCVCCHSDNLTISFTGLCAVRNISHNMASEVPSTRVVELGEEAMLNWQQRLLQPRRLIAQSTVSVTDVINRLPHHH